MLINDSLFLEYKLISIEPLPGLFKTLSVKATVMVPSELIVSFVCNQQLDLLIVVNQMLTGFDSKWINTLYLDKVLVYQNLIQAFFQNKPAF